MEPLPLAIAAILILLGIAGTFLPVLPGAILIWAGMLVYGFMTGFDRLDAIFYIYQGVAVLLVTAVDYMTVAWGTKRFGGTRRASIGAALGLLFGIIFLGPGGLILGPFLGAFLGELTSGMPPEKALRSSFGALTGLLGGVLLKLGIEAVMIFWFLKIVVF